MINDGTSLTETCIENEISAPPRVLFQALSNAQHGGALAWNVLNGWTKRWNRKW
jgi:hypothetical protein